MRDWKNVGAGVFKNVAGIGLQKAEGAVLGAFGMHGKPDGTASNPIHVILAGAGRAAAGVGSSVSGLVSSATTGAGGFLASLGSFAGKIFSGLGFADGGDPPVGMISLVGEHGPEPFIPKSAGTILPNSALGGSAVHHEWHIDARGASDPAAINAAVQRGIAKAMPTIAAATTHAQHNANSRLPMSRRR
jgi:hypothetical protein